MALAMFLLTLLFPRLILSSAESAPATFSTGLRCSAAPLLPTPSYGLKGAQFSVCDEQVIRGSLTAVYDAILDFRRYASWNSFVVSVAVPSNVTDAGSVYVDMPMILTTQGLLPFGMNSTSNEIITMLQPPQPGRSSAAVTAWRYDDGFGGATTRAEHPSILTDLGDGTVRCVSYETYYGVGAAALNVLLKQNLQKEFGIQGQDLKAYVEALGS